MTARLDDTLAALLEDVDTAPEGKALDAAFDALTDWVQDNRERLLLALAPPAPAPAPVITCVDKAGPVLRGFLAMLQKTEHVTYVPPAVTKRGTAFIPTPVPAFLTEDQFLLLLEAEAQAAEDMGNEPEAAGLRQDIRRRQRAHEAQKRREEQIAALGPPVAGRLTLARSSSV